MPSVAQLAPDQSYLKREGVLEGKALLVAQIEIGFDVIDVVQHQRSRLLNITRLQSIKYGGVVTMSAA